MRSSYLRLFATSLTISFIWVGGAFAQDDDTLSAAAGDRYVISAKAGHVNYVEGPVAVVRKTGKSGLLLKGDKLEIGDRVSTGVDGKVEILLNPGSFLRLGGLSAFEFETTTLDDLQLKIDSGSAILEVYATDEFKVSVRTPKVNYVLVETGVYRVDVPERGNSRLEVWRGLARVGATGEYVRSGRVATTEATGSATVAKFDRDEKDSLDIWSKERSKELARISSRLKRVNLRSNLMGAWGRTWNFFGSFGLWVFDPFYGGYCFLPFGYGWNSPYGYGYRHCVNHYNLPTVVYSPPTGHGTPTAGSGGPLTSSDTPARAVPAYMRVAETMGVGGGGRAGGAIDRGGSGYDSGPSYGGSSSSNSSPPPSSPPPSPPSTLGTGKVDSPGRP